MKQKSYDRKAIDLNLLTDCEILEGEKEIPAAMLP